MNSTIKTMGSVIVSGSKGVLLGGRICAVKGVDTYNLGNKSHLKTVLEVGRNELYEKEQALHNENREQLLNELSSLEKSWNKLLHMLAEKKEVPKEMLLKVQASIVAKGQELADLDAEISKLMHMTDPTMYAPVRVRGKAYGGGVIIINAIKYLLPMDVNRVIFKLRNKQVVMVNL